MSIMNWQCGREDCGETYDEHPDEENCPNCGGYRTLFPNTRV